MSALIRVTGELLFVRKRCNLSSDRTHMCAYLDKIAPAHRKWGKEVGEAGMKSNMPSLTRTHISGCGGVNSDSGRHPLIRPAAPPLSGGCLCYSLAGVAGGGPIQEWTVEAAGVPPKEQSLS